ncbi:MAG: amidohydrolase family protein [Lachnospiraceae bacterium]
MNIRLYNAKILNPQKDHSFTITEGEIWIQKDRIIYLGDGTDIDSVFSELPEKMILWDREMDINGNLILPGFKNAHTHTAMTFLRSLADDMPLSEWLTNQIFPREAQLTPEDIYVLTTLGLMEYVTSGITANFDMYLSPITAARAAVDCGFRTVQTSGLNNFSLSLSSMEEDYYRINEMSDLTSFVLGFHAEYTISKELMEGVSTLAHTLKSPVWLHNSETKKEVEDCIGRWGKTPTELTDSLSLYDYGGGGYHCVWLSDHDIEIFKKNKLSIVTNPASNLKLASGIAPIQRYLDEGIPLAIGTDGPASNNCLDMFREMYLCTALAKVHEQDAAAVPAQEVLYMATSGGAHAMGLTDCVNLDPGQKADLIVIDLKQPNMQPQNHLVNNLVYSGSKQNVIMTMVNGRILYQDQKFYMDSDAEEIYQKANSIIGRMRS